MTEEPVLLPSPPSARPLPSQSTHVDFPHTNGLCKDALRGRGATTMFPLPANSKGRRKIFSVCPWLRRHKLYHCLIDMNTNHLYVGVCDMVTCLPTLRGGWNLIDVSGRKCVHNLFNDSLLAARARSHVLVSLQRTSGQELAFSFPNIQKICFKK